ncbi:MAG: hypothetical protein ACLR6B_03070 [Blautia sp.]
MDKCWPLELTNMLASKYPGLLGYHRSLPRSKESGEVPWGDRCYVPIGATQAIIEKHGGDISE